MADAVISLSFPGYQVGSINNFCRTYKKKVVFQQVWTGFESLLPLCNFKC